MIPCGPGGLPCLRKSRSSRDPLSFREEGRREEAIEQRLRPPGGHETASGILLEVGALASDPIMEEIPLERQRVYEGRILNLRVDTVRLPSGRTALREIVERRGAVAIVPILADGRVVLVRQFRYAVGQVSLEIPAGTLEPGEEPLACARRELEEETGYQAARWERLGAIWPTPGYSTEEITLFIARDLTPGPARPEFDEALSVIPMSWSEIWEAIEEGRLRDAKSIVALAWAARRLGGR